MPPVGRQAVGVAEGDGLGQPRAANSYCVYIYIYIYKQREIYV